MNDTKRYEALIEKACGPRLRAEGAAIGEARGIVIGEARGEVRGEARGKAEAVLTVLRARFKKVPREVEKAIRDISDSIALESWTVHAATCQSMEEFAEALE